MPPVYHDQDVRAHILRLKQDGRSNRQIGSALGIHHQTIGIVLREMGWIQVGHVRKGFNPISPTFAICAICGSTKPHAEFQFIRPRDRNPYRIARCNACRRDQLLANMNRDIGASLLDRWRRLVVRCRRDRVDCHVTHSDLVRLWSNQYGLCFYTDEPMTWMRGLGELIPPNQLSIDKISPTSGYVSGNVVLCGYRVNSIKRDVSLDEMRLWMPAWYSRAIAFYVEQGSIEI